jgi:hypothetical protein
MPDLVLFDHLTRPKHIKLVEDYTGEAGGTAMDRGESDEKAGAGRRSRARAPPFTVPGLSCTLRAPEIHSHSSVRHSGGSLAPVPLLCSYPCLTNFCHRAAVTEDITRRRGCVSVQTSQTPQTSEKPASGLGGVRAR